ncbi:bifunctional glutamine-synthetase adenylyltransferase/deadenyltransferase [Vibrio vulnificus]|nr:bifunctional glutamine-synthetase adenylyltransferase/deadenyltransferase [Vibrio vulnificus]
MSLPSPLIPVAELAMQNAQQSGYLEHWPQALITQFQFISGLSKFVVETVLRDAQLAESLPEMLAQESRQEAYRNSFG